MPVFEDVQADRGHILEWLTEGECDIAVGHVPQLPDGLSSTLVFVESLLGVAAAHHHPLLGERVTEAELAQASREVFGSPSLGRVRSG